MGALPRPDLPPGAQRDLNDALHDLHHRAGWPSLRALAREAGCSHTTVSKAFSTAGLPDVGRPRTACGGHARGAELFRELWLAASTPPPTARGPVRRASPGSLGARSSSPPFAATSPPARACSWSPARPESARRSLSARRRFDRRRHLRGHRVLSAAVGRGSVAANRRCLAHNPRNGRRSVDQGGVGRLRGLRPYHASGLGAWAGRDRPPARGRKRMVSSTPVRRHRVGAGIG